MIFQICWETYESNYENALHCAVEFDYGANGSFNTIIKVIIVQRKVPLHMTIIMCLYLANVVYYLFITVVRIRDHCNFEEDVCTIDQNYILQFLIKTHW